MIYFCFLNAAVWFVDPKTFFSVVQPVWLINTRILMKSYLSIIVIEKLEAFLGLLSPLTFFWTLSVEFTSVEIVKLMATTPLSIFLSDICLLFVQIFVSCLPIHLQHPPLKLPRRLQSNLSARIHDTQSPILSVSSIKNVKFQSFYRIADFFICALPL